MYVRETGPAGAPTLVFLHAVGTSGWMWEEQARRLGAFHCLIPDLPGHGESRGLPWHSLDDTVGQVRALIARRATHGRAHVVGLSLGAYVALRLLQGPRDGVERVVLSGVNVLPYPAPRLMRLMGYAMLPLLKTEWMVRANARGLRIPPEHYAAYRASARAVSRPAFLRIGNELLGFGLEPGEVPHPALFLAGTNEHALIRDSVRELVRAFPRGEGYLVPGVGHGWNGEAPELFARTVESWIAGRALPPELVRVPG